MEFVVRQWVESLPLLFLLLLLMLRDRLDEHPGIHEMSPFPNLAQSRKKIFFLRLVELSHKTNKSDSQSVFFSFGLVLCVWRREGFLRFVFVSKMISDLV